MKPKKDIFDMMRDDQHKLDERPSPRAWRKLERKLDHHHSRNRTIMYKQFAMVAAVVALVAVASLIFLINERQSPMMANTETVSNPYSVEDIETVYTDANEELHKVIEFKRSLERNYANNPIAEGTQSKKLLASNHSNVKVETNYNPSNSNREMIAMNENKTNSYSNEKLASPSKPAKPLAKEKVSEPEYAENISTSSGNVLNAESDVIAEEKSIVEANDAVITSSRVEAKSKIQEESESVTEVVAAEPAPAMVDEIVTSSAPAAMSKVKKMNTPSIVIDKKSTKWLVGKWKMENDNSTFEIKRNANKMTLIFNNKTYLLTDLNSLQANFKLDNNEITIIRTKDNRYSYLKNKESGKLIKIEN